MYLLESDYRCPKFLLVLLAWGTHDVEPMRSSYHAAASVPIRRPGRREGRCGVEGMMGR
jgi:hypothetical protein